MANEKACRCPSCGYMHQENKNGQLPEVEPLPGPQPLPAFVAAEPAPASTCPVCGFTTVDGELFNSHMREGLHEGPAPAEPAPAGGETEPPASDPAPATDPAPVIEEGENGNVPA